MKIRLIGILVLNLILKRVSNPVFPKCCLLNSSLTQTLTQIAFPGPPLIQNITNFIPLEPPRLGTPGLNEELNDSLLKLMNLVKL